jgi:hypothetical protein
MRPHRVVFFVTAGSLRNVATAENGSAAHNSTRQHTTVHVTVCDRLATRVDRLVCTALCGCKRWVCSGAEWGGDKKAERPGLKNADTKRRVTYASARKASPVYEGSLSAGISEASMPMFCNAKQRAVEHSTAQHSTARRSSETRLHGSITDRQSIAETATPRTALALGGRDAAAAVDVELAEHCLQTTNHETGLSKQLSVPHLANCMILLRALDDRAAA